MPNWLDSHANDASAPPALTHLSVLPPSLRISTSYESCSYVTRRPNFGGFACTRESGASTKLSSAGFEQGLSNEELECDSKYVSAPIPSTRISSLKGLSYCGRSSIAFEVVARTNRHRKTLKGHQVTSRRATRKNFRDSCMGTLHRRCVLGYGS